jgi:transcriptional regulator with XRE-family HTH domain
MSDANGPTVRRRRLGLELRRLREGANLDQAAAARHLECSTSKISRMEKGEGIPKAIELDWLLDLYKVDGEEARATLATIRKKAAETGWWEQAEYESVLPSGLGVYVGLEYDARSVRAWELGYLPGLLQTEDYARAVLSARGTRGPGEVDRLARVRMQRQQRVTAQQAALELWAIVDEATLRRPVGGAQVMRAQLLALRSAMDLPNVTVQIHPLAKAPHPGLLGSFSILEFGPSDPSIGYMESRGGNLFVEKDVQVRQLSGDFDHLRAGALDPVESAAFINELTAKESS